MNLCGICHLSSLNFTTLLYQLSELFKHEVTVHFLWFSMSLFFRGMANLCGLSGLRGSEWVEWVKWVRWFTGKTSFLCIIDILRKEVTSCFSYCFESLFKPLHPLCPLHPHHPIIISYSYFALVVQTLLMQDWNTEKIDPDRSRRA